MIISHSQKFIFLKSRKTAGTSIEILLSQLYKKGDIYTPFGHNANCSESLKDEKKRKIFNINFEGCFKYTKFSKYSLSDLKFITKNKKIIKDLIFHEHESPNSLKIKIDQSIWSNYYKFVFIRNPYDYSVSLFEWKKSRAAELNIKFSSSFNSFLLDYFEELISLNNFAYIDEEIPYNFVGKFENLEEDVNYVLSELNLNIKNIIPKSKNNIRKNKDYKSYYDEESYNFVSYCFKKIIKDFNYSF
jgi:hypothetical protein